MNTADRLAAAVRAMLFQLDQGSLTPALHERDACIAEAREALAEYTKNQNKVRVGVRVRVTNPGFTFGDYDIGDTGVVRRVTDNGGIEVTWDKPRFDVTYKENNRCTYLSPGEYEVMEDKA